MRGNDRRHLRPWLVAVASLAALLVGDGRVRVTGVARADESPTPSASADGSPTPSASADESPTPSASADESPSPGDSADDARKLQKIAEKAYIYGFPIVATYGAIFQHAIDTGSPEFRAPLNQIANEARWFTAQDSLPVPDDDVARSFVALDLRAEPVVLCTPDFDPGRYHSIEVFDLYTNVFAVLGSGTTGSSAGCFLVAGPGWSEPAPSGVRDVLRADTWLASAIYRTQIYDADDIGAVQSLQAKYTVQPLSRFLGREAPPQPSAISFPKFDPKTGYDADLFPTLGFLLELCPRVKGERSLRERFRRIGLVPGRPFAFDQLSISQAQEAVDRAYERIEKTAEAIVLDADGWQASVSAGNRATFGRNWLLRAAIARNGLYGPVPAEAVYWSTVVDDAGKRLDGRESRYAWRLAADRLPPVDGFWSLTMYDAKTRKLVESPTGRILINSRMVPKMTRESDGALTIYLQKDAPGGAEDANWLPAPDGPFFVALRMYRPRETALEGGWAPPTISVR